MGLAPRGLESLPTCWWAALLKLTLEFATKHPFNLVQLSQRDGCLVLLMTDARAPREICLRWMSQLEQSLYPIRSRRLKERDQALLNPALGSKHQLNDLPSESEPDL